MTRRRWCLRPKTARATALRTRPFSLSPRTSRRRDLRALGYIARCIPCVLLADPWPERPRGCGCPRRPEGQRRLASGSLQIVGDDHLLVASIAEALGVDLETLWQYEAGRRPLSVATLYQLAELLDERLERLVGR